MEAVPVLHDVRLLLEPRREVPDHAAQALRAREGHLAGRKFRRVWGPSWRQSLQATLIAKAIDSVAWDPLDYWVEYFMVFEEVCEVHRAKYVDQKVFDGRISPPWLSWMC